MASDLALPLEVFWNRYMVPAFGVEPIAEPPADWAVRVLRHAAVYQMLASAMENRGEPHNAASHLLLEAERELRGLPILISKWTPSKP